MKILIAGYYGFANVGDELILSSILTLLKKRYDNPQITVLSADPTETADYHQVQAVSRWNLFNLITQLWKNDLLVVGGGGLLQNKTSQRSLLYYLGLIFLARVLQCPIVLFAMGVETLQGRFARWLTKTLLSTPDVKITVRDEMSKQILSDVGISPASIFVTADPVFALASNIAPRDRYSAHAASALLIPRFPCPASGRRLFAIMGRVLREEKKMNVRGLLFQPQMEAPYLQNFNGESILSEQDFKLELTLDEMVAEIPQYDWIISARFHGLVLAALAGRPFIGVGDPHKVGRLCSLLKMPFLSWEASENEIKAAVERILLKKFEMQTNVIDRLRTAALQTTNHVG